jgi:hypothetical protein
MSENKTKPTTDSVSAFLAAIEDEQCRKDSETLVGLMRAAAGTEPKLWGSSIIGFGQYHYVYESGREGDSMLTGFAPRKPALTLYITGGFEGQEALLEKLGKHKVGGGCLYIKQLDDVHLPTLKKIIAKSVAAGKKKNQPAKARR